MNSSFTSSSDRRTGARIAGFFAGVVLVLVVLYQIGGYGRKDGNTWFRSLPPPGGRDTLEILFLGSSRVAAGIDTARFDSIASIVAHRPVRSFNLGMGFSTLHELLFALREQGKKGGLKNRLVLLEAPGGLPQHARWDDPWFQEDTRSMLSRYMAPSDLPRMWLEAKLGAADKSLVTVEVLTGWRNNFWRLRTVVTDRVRGSLHGVGAMFRPGIASEAVAPAKALVFERGGIRLDASRIGKIRQAAIEFAATESADPRPWTGWDSTLLSQIVEQVRSGGGEMALFEIPLCSHQRRVYESPRRREGAVEFAGFRERIGLGLTLLDTTYGDGSFPDLWHLGIPEALDFSGRLAVSVLDGRSPGPGLEPARVAAAAADAGPRQP